MSSDELPDAPDSAAPADVESRPRVRWLLDRVGLGTTDRREWFLVTLMVVSATLSAFAFWQSSSFSEEANTRNDDAHLLEIEGARQRAEYEARIDHDLGLFQRYCESIFTRDAGLHDAFLDPSSAAAIGDIVRSERVASALTDLYSLAPPSEPDCRENSYRVDIQDELFFRLSLTSADRPEALRTAAVAAGDSEKLLVFGSVMAAVAFLFLTLIDAVSGSTEDQPVSRILQGLAMARRRQALLWFTAVAGLATALGTLVTGVIRTGSGQIVPIAGLVVVAIVFYAFKPRGERARVTAPAGPGTRFAAELIASLVVVVFAVSAFGLTQASNETRAARAESDSLAETASQLLRSGLQVALVDLETETDARIELGVRAADNQNNLGPPEPDDLGALVTSQNDAVREAVRADARRARTVKGGACDGEIPPAPDSFDWTQFAANTVPASECQARESLTRQLAADWDAQTSRFTISLIILGLAGFVLALAADGDRRAPTANWLLRVGVVGLLVGLGVALLAWFDQPRPLEAGRVDEITTGYAEAKAQWVSAASPSECKAILEGLDTIIADGDPGPEAIEETLRSVGSLGADVSHLRASLLSCGFPWLVWVDPDSGELPRYLDAVNLARELSPEDPAVTHSLAWGRLLEAADGAEEDRAGTAEEGLDLIREVMTQGNPNLYTCFNYALGTLIRSGYDAAESEYRAVMGTSNVHAPTVPEGCGESFAGSNFSDFFKILALADLERVTSGVDSRSLDLMRQLIVSGGTRHSTGSRERIDTVALTVGLQALSITTADDSLGEETLSAVWYHRPFGREHWSIVFEPTFDTLSAQTGVNEKLWETGALTTPGDYRVDLYDATGRLMGFADARVELPGPVASRVHAEDLGVSFVAPTGWEALDPTDCTALDGGPNPWHGVEVWHGLAGCSELIALRRIDSISPEVLDVSAEVGSEVSTWLQDELSRWVDSLSSVLPQPVVIDDRWETERPYFLSLEPAVVSGGPGHWAAAAFSSYAVSPACPGIQFLALVVSPDDQLRDRTVASLYPEFWPPLGLPALDLSRFGLGLEFPLGWDAVASPAEGWVSDAVVALDCTTKSNVRVSLHELGAGDTLQSYADTNVASLATLDEFVDLGRFAGQTANGVPTETIYFSWNDEGAPIEQAQVYAVAGDTGYLLTFTPGDDGVVDYSAVFTDLIASYNLFGLDGGAS